MKYLLIFSLGWTSQSVFREVEDIISVRAFRECNKRYLEKNIQYPVECRDELDYSFVAKIVLYRPYLFLKVK